MKKGIVVLLIAVLAAGFAFAGLTGYAEVDFGVDFDDADWGFTNKRYGKYSFGFSLDSASVSVGGEHATDIWAELEASGSATLYLSSSILDSTKYGSQPNFYSIEISKADIHIGEDLTIGILSAGTAVDFAKSYYKVTWLGTDSNDYKKNGSDATFTSYKSYSFNYDTLGGSSVVYGASEAAPGVEVTFKDWYGGIGMVGNWEDETYTIFAHVATPKFKFAEDALTVQAGGYAMLNDSDNYAGGGAKVAYAAEKVSADAGVDLRYDDEKFLFEAAANAELNFVEEMPITFNLYMTPGALAEANIAYRYSKKAGSYPIYAASSIGYTGDYAEVLKLDAKAAVEYALAVNEDITVDTEAYVSVTDILLEDAREIEAYVGASTSVDALDFELGFDYYVFGKELDIYAYVGYNAEKFTAYAEIDSIAIDLEGNSDLEFPLEVGVKSSSIVEGATLALVYANDDFVAENKGAIKASCKISF